MAGKLVLFKKFSLLAFDPPFFSLIFPPKSHKLCFGCEKGCM
jgi:hypothetical protein